MEIKKTFTYNPCIKIPSDIVKSGELIYKKSMPLFKGSNPVFKGSTPVFKGSNPTFGSQVVRCCTPLRERGYKQLDSQLHVDYLA